MAGRISLSSNNEPNVGNWSDAITSSIRIDIDNSDSPSAIEFSDRGDYVFVTLQGNNSVAVFDHLRLLDGGHDGRTFDFTQRGEGLRNTTDLRGRGGMAHGNVHWTANFDEIQDFIIDIMEHQLGTGFLPPAKPRIPPSARPMRGAAWNWMPLPHTSPRWMADSSPAVPSGLRTVK